MLLEPELLLLELPESRPELDPLPLELLDPPPVEADAVPPLLPESVLPPEELLTVLSEPVLEDDDCDDESELPELVPLEEELPLSLELLPETEPLEELLPVSLEPVLDEPESPELVLLEEPDELSPLELELSGLLSLEPLPLEELLAPSFPEPDCSPPVGCEDCPP